MYIENSENFLGTECKKTHINLKEHLHEIYSHLSYKMTSIVILQIDKKFYLKQINTILISFIEWKMKLLYSLVTPHIFLTLLEDY